MDHNFEMASWLNYLARKHEDLVKTRVRINNRLGSLPLHPENDPKNDGTIIVLEKEEGRTLREIEKLLPIWPLWDRWLDHIPGIGPTLGARLILLYYYRWIPICPKCGGDLQKAEQTFICAACGHKVKGDGVLKHRGIIRVFDTISKLWAFCGRAVEEDGRLQRRKKDTQSRHSTRAKTVTFLVADEFKRMKPDHPYRQFYLSRKAKREQTHPDASKGHRDNMAMNETAKLFLAHLWVVARTLDGLPVSKPYAHTLLKPAHINYIKPFYWDGAVEVKEAA